MHQTNPTEMFRERHLMLLREVQSRRPRAARSKGRPRSEAKMAGFERATALWGRISVPFFGG